MKKLQRKTLLIGSLALVFAITIGGTIAYLFTFTEEVSNTFIEAILTTEIEETIVNDTKNDVKIKNTGNIDAYIRAMVVVTWQNAAGDVLGTAPVEDTDYSIVWTMENWFQGSDGFYYYKNPVASKASTGQLFTECKLKENVNSPKEDYYLNVEIIASGIQAEPVSTVESVWGVTTEEVEVDGNKVVILQSK